MADAAEAENYEYEYEEALERAMEFSGDRLPAEVYHWLENMAQKEANVMVQFLLSPRADIEQQVRYVDFFLQRYGAFVCKLEKAVLDLEAEKEELFDRKVISKASEVTSDGKNYSIAFAERWARIQPDYVAKCAELRELEYRLKLARNYLRNLERKGSKLMGVQGTYNRMLGLGGMA